MPKIFISHISEESKLAQLLKQKISDTFENIHFDDIFVSSDGKSLSAGSDWFIEINSHLTDAQILIILCSKESIIRPWVNFEAGAFWSRNKLIIPVCHSGMLSTDLPIPLSLKNAIDGGTVSGIRTLFETIRNSYNPKPILSVNYSEIVEDFKSMESDRSIKNPRILCAASEQYNKLEFDLDINVLTSKFPDQVIVERNLTSRTLRKLLTSSPRFDLIHVAIAIDEDNGDLIFSDVDPITHMPVGNVVDKMSANGFATLVQQAGTSLIVLATCNSYPLAIEVASVTNMIAANKDIYAKKIEVWSDCFYDLLKKGEPLFCAYETTRKVVDDVPLRLIQRRDVTFTFSPK